MRVTVVSEFQQQFLRVSAGSQADESCFSRHQCAQCTEGYTGNVIGFTPIARFDSKETPIRTHQITLIHRSL